MISIIVAMTSNNYIGKDNKLLFHIKEDMKRFKSLTIGHKVIMGRKTFESLPNGPLMDRENIVITSNKNYNPDGVIVCKDVLELIQKYVDSEEEVFVIGGESIYDIFLIFASKIYLTKIYSDIIGDRKFNFDEDKYKITKEEPIKIQGNINYQFFEIESTFYIKSYIPFSSIPFDKLSDIV